MTGDDRMRMSTDDGDLRGGEEEGVRVFRGVPYARPPVRGGPGIPGAPAGGGVASSACQA
jgi:hypothetical protein